MRGGAGPSLDAGPAPVVGKKAQLESGIMELLETVVLSIRLVKMVDFCWVGRDEHFIKFSMSTHLGRL